eukprot:gene169-903_t
MSTRHKFGLIGDIQYADTEDGTDFSGTQRRYFRGSLETTEKAVETWNKEKVNFIVQLGDIIDGRCAKIPGESDKCLARVLDALNKASCPRYDLIGNHELYNYSRKKLASCEIAGDVRENCKAGCCGGYPPIFPKSWRNPALALFEKKPGEAGERFYYRIDVNSGDSDWRILCLDSYEIATIGFEENDPREKIARNILSKHNPKALQKNVDWFEGLPEHLHRYCAFNGGLGEAQLNWLRDELEDARFNKKSAIVISHIPCYEPATCPKTILFDSEECLKVIGDFNDVVKVFVGGHDHDGGFAVDDNNVIHMTVGSPMMVAPGSDCCCVVTLSSLSKKEKDEREKLLKEGKGSEKIMTPPRASGVIKFFGKALPKGQFQEGGNVKGVLNDGRTHLNEVHF